MTANQVKLTEYWLDLAEEAIASAQILFANGRSRQSCGRAYYAMFYCVKALLVELKLKTSKHKGAIALFDLHFINTGQLTKELSAWIHQAFRMRQKADYGESFEYDNETVREQILRAEAFLAAIKAKLGVEMEGETEEGVRI